MSKINNINISGPINIVRIEGIINGDEKILYLFFDFHTRETKCSDYGSIDVVQLFDKFTNSANKFKNEWDLFIEDDINLIYDKNVIKKSDYVDIYLMELRNYFNNKFSEKVNDVIKKKDNIRYHYFDLRWKNNFSNIWDSLSDLIQYNYYKDLFYNKMDNIYKLVLVDYDYIFKKENKINDKYNNKKLKGLIMNLLEDYEDKFKKLLKDFKDIMNELKDSDGIFLKKLTNDGRYFYYNDIKNKISDFQNNYTYLNARIIDLYFLRRFLDKKYIKNGVIYSGADHSINIIFILVKIFKFKITNASYSKIELDKLNKFIKKSKNFTDLRNQLFPEYFIQCSSMKGFPDMFL